MKVKPDRDVTSPFPKGDYFIGEQAVYKSNRCVLKFETSPKEAKRQKTRQVFSNVLALPACLDNGDQLGILDKAIRMQNLGFPYGH